MLTHIVGRQNERQKQRALSTLIVCLFYLVQKSELVFIGWGCST